MTTNKVRDGLTASNSNNFYGYPHATGMFSQAKSQLDVLLDQCDLAIHNFYNACESQENFKHQEMHKDVESFRRAIVALKTNKPAAYQHAISRIEIHIEAEYLRLLSLDDQRDITDPVVQTDQTDQTDHTDFPSHSSLKVTEELRGHSVPTNSLNAVKKRNALMFKQAVQGIFDDAQLSDIHGNFIRAFQRIDSYNDRYYAAKQRLAHIIEQSKRLAKSGGQSGAESDTMAEASILVSQKAFLEAIKDILANTASDEFNLRADIVNDASEPSGPAYLLMHSVTSEYTQAFDELCHESSLYERVSFV